MTEEGCEGGVGGRGSLRTRPLEKSERGSGRWAGAEVYTAPGMQARFRLVHDCMPLVQFKETKISRICWREKLLEHRLAFIGPTHG